LALLPYFFGPIISVVVWLGMVILLVNALTRAARTRAAAIDLHLITYALGFFTLHWLLAFPVWDRYLLILVPIGAMLLGRLVTLLGERLSSHSQVAIKLPTHPFILGVVTLAMLPVSIQAARSELPIGGDHGSRDGIDQVAAYLRDLPIGTVVYDHWLGWEFHYYLWDAPLYRAYFDTPADLARDLRVFGRASTRYIVSPASESPNKIARAIGAQGFALTPVLTTTDRFGQTSFTVYQVTSR